MDTSAKPPPPTYNVRNINNKSLQSCINNIYKKKKAHYFLSKDKQSFDTHHSAGRLSLCVKSFNNHHTPPQTSSILRRHRGLTFRVIEWLLIRRSVISGRDSASHTFRLEISTVCMCASCSFTPRPFTCPQQDTSTLNFFIKERVFVASFVLFCSISSTFLTWIRWLVVGSYFSTVVVA